jgi:outer membrane protein OmpA-like peptidoglycan-associated protein
MMDRIRRWTVSWSESWSVPRSKVRRDRAPERGVLILVAMAIGLAGPAAAGEPGTQEINRLLYKQLESTPSAGKVETVSGQMYIKKENIDKAVISDALAAMLDQQQTAGETVSVHRGPRLNFEIHFKKNSAELTPESRKSLDQLGEVLAADYLDTRFILGGHTDLDGDEAVNGPLSQARADTARTYLVETFQIEPNRLVATGFGMSDPLRQVEKSPEDKLYNRRVDLRPIRPEQ